MLWNKTARYEEILARIPEASKIGAGASGTVRIAWLQERKMQQQDEQPHACRMQRPVMLLGVCAAVAVKRVVLPVTSTGDQRALYKRQMLLRELQLLECVRCHPHPNVVQCWGFYFAHPDLRPAPGAGLILTSLAREQQRAGVSGDDLRVFGVAPYIDMCLSLCTGGSLDAYVRRRVLEASNSRMKTQCLAGLETPTTRSEALSALGITDTPPRPEGNGQNRSEEEWPIHTTPSRRDLGSAKETMEMAARERDIVAILYALVNGLRHTHEVLQTLHRDIKPANILLCSGAGDPPMFAKSSSFATLTPLIPTTAIKQIQQQQQQQQSQQSQQQQSQQQQQQQGARQNPVPTSVHGNNLIEYALFADRPPCDIPDGAAHAPPRVLVSPLDSSGCRVGAISYLPQSSAWRIQLADYGIATGLGRLSGGGRCGTFPFTAPEVVTSDASHLYGPAADVFSLGVTMQYVVSRFVLDASMAERRDAPLAAEWIDEEEEKQKQEQEEEQEQEEDTEDRSTAAHAHVEGSEGNMRKAPFIVPSAWRCREELLCGSFIRRGAGRIGRREAVDEHEKDSAARNKNIQSAQRDNTTEPFATMAHAHVLAALPRGPEDVDEFISRERRGTRCRSCGKLHRHLIELLNAMTDAEPSRRPPLAAVLRSAAVVEQGNFATDAMGQARGARRRKARSPPGFRITPQQQQQLEGGEEQQQQQQQNEGGLLWRPPSLDFLCAYGDGDML